MIRHDNKFVQNNIFSDRICPLPFLHNNPPHVIQHHFPIHNFTKQAFTLPGAYRDKIRAGLRIIVILQADGMAVVYVGVVGHKRSFHILIVTDLQQYHFFFSSSDSVGATRWVALLSL